MTTETKVAPQANAEPTKANSKPHPIWRWLVIIGVVEAVSFLILLFVAVPIKYIGGNPMFVETMGPIHGAFFLLYVAMVIVAARAFHWHFVRICLALVASVIPFGPFIFDAWLRRQPDAFGE